MVSETEFQSVVEEVLGHSEQWSSFIFAFKPYYGRTNLELLEAFGALYEASPGFAQTISSFLVVWLQQSAERLSKADAKAMLDVSSRVMHPETFNSLKLMVLKKCGRHSLTVVTEMEHSVVDVLDESPLDIAIWLTMIEWRDFCTIPPSALIDPTHYHLDADSTGPLAQMIRRHNNVTFYFAHKIVSCRSVRDCTSKIEIIISILGHLVKLNNFQSAAQVLGSLCLSCVSRLSSAWSGLSSSSQKSFDTSRRILSPEKNFKKYRSRLTKCVQKNEPLIPYLAVIQRDITYMYDNRKSMAESLDDYSNAITLGIYANTLQSYQEANYDYSAREIGLFFFRNLPSIPSTKREGVEDEFYQLSLRLEPKIDVNTRKEKAGSSLSPISPLSLKNLTSKREIPKHSSASNIRLPHQHTRSRSNPNLRSSLDVRSKTPPVGLHAKTLSPFGGNAPVLRGRAPSPPDTRCAHLPQDQSAESFSAREQEQTALEYLRTPNSHN